MPLAAGARLGRYEVTAQIGAGGMGEVYRATDTDLKRAVAIKVLPREFAADPQRLARLRREAEVLASLSHPNIAAIYGLERDDATTALVMEFIEGSTLASRIDRSPIPLDEALPIASQIAAALEAAHDQGVVHRDLKPANIMLRTDGTVKVLDFGLAKAAEAAADDSSPRSLSESPTITTPAATRMGTILGTAAYMSPEQARGKAVDKRTDVWAFGCVLYEMLTGRRAFPGNEVSDVLASILAREPDFAALPAATPPAIRRLLRRCLRKDHKERLRDIADIGLEIREAITGRDPHESVHVVAAPSRRVRAMLVAALAVAALSATAAAIVWWVRPESPLSEVRLDITTPPTNVPESLAISPDGRTIAFVAIDDGQSRLWVRSLNSEVAQPLKGTEGAQVPFWSPNSQSIGFFADNRVKRIDINGGSVQILANAYRGTGGTWGTDGSILISSLGDPISRIPDTGGVPVELKGLFQQGSNFAPHFLPDGRRFLYYVRGTEAARGVYVGDLDGTAPTRRLFDSDAGAVYSRASGHLLFVRQGTLFAQPFDAVRLQLAGTPRPVGEVAAKCACLGLSVSDTGLIAYRPSAERPVRQFSWFDRSGKEIGKVGNPMAMSSPSLSLDGERVVGYRGNPVDGNVDVWVLETRRGVSTRLTTDVGDDVSPVWSADNTRVLFASNRNGVHNLYQIGAAAGSTEELVLASDDEKTPSDWSADGRFVLFDRRDARKGTHIWALPLQGDRKPFPFAHSDFDEHRGQFSPDGKWVAYHSDESGRQEIYVQPFPGPGNKSLVSTDSGTQARWRRDGKELFYVRLDGRLMAVPIRLPASSDQRPEIGTPVELFSPPLGGAVQQADFRHQYMVSADGQKFLVATITPGAPSPITVILGWKPRR